MIQLNLLPDLKREYLKSQRVKKLFIFGSFTISVAFIGFVIVALVFVGAQRLHMDRLQDDIDAAVSQIDAETDLNKVITIQKQLSALPGLHDQKPAVGRMFGYLSNLAPGNVTLSKVSFAFDTAQNTVEISGSGEDTKAVNTFVDTLKNAQYEPSGSSATPAFTQVVLDSIAVTDEDGVVYSVLATFEPVIFDNSTTGSLSVPSITTSSSVKDRPVLFNAQTSEGDD